MRRQSKPVRRTRRANARDSRGPRRRRASRPPDRPARRDARARPLLERIRDTPHLAQAVPRLRPELLHRVIQRVGLEDCAELVTLATPQQLSRVFDLDLWRPAVPGSDEQFDASRFGVWLEVLLESGATVAAQKVGAMDVELIITGLAQHALVFDAAALAAYTTLDGTEIPAVRTFDDRPTCEVGGYLLVARRTERCDAWDAIIDVLLALESERRAYFHEVMAGCRTLSSSGFELDELDDLLSGGDQAMFDLAFDRERRQASQGYMTPAQARAFLQMARGLQLASATMPAVDPVTRAYFRAIEEPRPEAHNSASRREPAEPDAPPGPESSAEAVAAVVDVLVEAGIVAPQPRALLTAAPEEDRLGRIKAQMQYVLERDDVVASVRNRELAYLANVIMAGCSIQARPFTAQEASDAAVAVCNLGLENWPARWLTAEARQDVSVVDGDAPLPADVLVAQDLVSVFQVGWKVLFDEVCMYAAEQLMRVLGRLRCSDPDTQAGIDDLRIEMTRHCQAGAPWHARDALDVIAVLDMPAWAALLGLIDECPVLCAGIGAPAASRPRAVSATAFEFISQNRQIAAVREFMEALPEALRP